MKKAMNSGSNGAVRIPGNDYFQPGPCTYAI
jgi:hypothetical protein